MPGHALGIDFGTSHTVAVARWPDGRARPLLIDGSPLLPSAVYADPGGALAVGRDAMHSARLDPARFEPNPKRRIDDGALLLGDREVPVVELVAAVFGRVAEEWARTVGPARPEVTVTCPATWGVTRRRLLADAAARAGFDGVRLVAEPVAAATYFAKVLGRDVPVGSAVVVHDFGAGTFDASVVARTAGGFEVLAVDGRDDLGGIDVDAALVAHLREAYADRDPLGWARLDTPTTVEERRAKRQFWDDVRVAKERLSRSPTADLVIPLLEVEAHLTRAELEKLATPILAQAVEVTQGVLSCAKVVAGVFLVGGSSRIPLMATLLHRALGSPPVAIEQPELVVAEGSILASEVLLASAPPAPGPTMLLPRQVSPASGSAPVVPPAVDPWAGAPLPDAVADPWAAPDPMPPTPAAAPTSPAHAPSQPPAPAASSAPGAASSPMPGAWSSPAPAPSAPSTSSAASSPAPGASPARASSAPGVVSSSGRAASPAPGPPLSSGRSASSSRPGPSLSAGPSGSPGPSADAAQVRPVGRVTMPDAQPPGRTRKPARPLAPTRTMPRSDEPTPAPTPDRRPSKRRPRRRPGLVVRTFRALFLLALLIVVLAVAAVLALSIARGEPLEETVRNVVEYVSGVRSQG